MSGRAAGDRFTVSQQWYDLSSDGQMGTRAVQDGGRIVFGSDPVTWKILDAAPGEYVIGFIAEDLYGNRTDSYTQVTVP